MDTPEPSESMKSLENRVDSETNVFTFNIKKIVEETNQLLKEGREIVGDVLRSNNDLRGDMESLSSKMDTFLTNMNEFLNLLKLASQDVEPSDNLTKKLSEIADYNKNMLQINQSMLTTLELMDKKLKRLYSEPGEEAKEKTLY